MRCTLCIHGGQGLAFRLFCFLALLRAIFCVLAFVLLILLLLAVFAPLVAAVLANRQELGRNLNFVVVVAGEETVNYRGHFRLEDLQGQVGVLVGPLLVVWILREVDHHVHHLLDDHFILREEV